MYIDVLISYSTLNVQKVEILCPLPSTRRFAPIIVVPPIEMEEAQQTSSRPHELDYHPELIHHIQSLLPVEEAARTCVLSKSWLHAWSTIPTLRFPQSKLSDCKEERSKLMKLVDHTLVRYLRDNLPIESLDLKIDDVNEDLDSLAEKWIQPVATKSCLKELSLSIEIISIDMFALPDEIFSGKNLNTIRVSGFSLGSSSLVINCVSLRVLELSMVRISEEVFHNLLSTCSLLEKMNLSSCIDLKTIKLKNLAFLCEFKLGSVKVGDVLEIESVPNLRLFSYDGSNGHVLFNMDQLANVRELTLCSVILEDTFFDMLKSSKFPFLESLTLGMSHWSLESVDITCVSLKRLSLHSFSLRSYDRMLIDIQVNAPKLVYFRYDGKTMPSLLFSSIVPEQIVFDLYFRHPIGNSFFLKMREALMLPSKFHIDIVTFCLSEGIQMNIDVDDMRRRVPFPAMNVQKLLFKISPRKGLWKPLVLIDAFFWICHPKKIVIECNGNNDGMLFKNNNYFWKLMVRQFMEKKTTKTKEGCWRDYVEHVELQSNCFGRWETQTDSWRSFLYRSAPVRWDCIEIIPNWYSSSS